MNQPGDQLNGTDTLRAETDILKCVMHTEHEDIYPRVVVGKAGIGHMLHTHTRVEPFP